jgi:phage host-nuclease inhibitor protein Gam
MAKAKKRTLKIVSEEIQSKEDEILKINEEYRAKMKILRNEIRELEKEKQEFKIECEHENFVSIAKNKIQCSYCGIIKTIN